MNYRARALTLAAAVSTVIAGSATAQTATRPAAPTPSASEGIPAAGDQSDDIIVTARRVSENQQNVPMSLTALSGDLLERKDVTTVYDLTRLAPSLYVATGLSRNSTGFAIRGQRGTASSVGTGGGPSVIAYFGEAPLSAAGPGLFFDLSSVQVLAGPQGTLFGKNTTGGAILFEPRRPTSDFEGYLEGTTGSYGRLDVEGVINVPIISDKVLLRVGAQSQNRDGFTRDVVSGRKYDDRDAFNARASLLIKPSASFENLTIASVNNSEENGPGIVLIAANPAGRFAPQFAQTLAAQQARGIRAVSLDAKSRDGRRTFSIVNRTTFNISDTLALTNIFSFTRARTVSGRDDDGTPYPIQDSNGALPGTWASNSKSITEELRLSGEVGGGLIKFQVGGYFDSLWPAGLSTYTQALQQASTTSQLDSQSRVKTYAGFGQAQLDFGKIIPALEGLNFTAGYRHTKNENSYSINLLTFNGIFYPPPAPTTTTACISPPTAFYPNCNYGGSKTDTGESWNFGLDYKVASRVMVFANIKRGFKAGGFNPVVLAFGGTPAAVGYSYLPETVTTTEGGLKSEWSIAGLRGRLNVTAYQSKYQNIQAAVSFRVGNFTTGGFQNAARATIKGIELDGSIRINRIFSIDGGYSYTDAHYDRYISGTTDLTSLPFSQTPKNKFNISGLFTLPLPPAFGELIVSGTYSRQDKIYAGGANQNQPFSYIDGYGLVNARVEWNNVLNTKNIDLAVFATNLTGKVYRVAVIQQYNASGYTSAIYGEPRMYGASLRVRF